MKVTNNISLERFNAWSGAVDTKQRIMDEGLSNDFDDMISDLYPNGLTETEFNDLLWFEEDWIYKHLGIDIDEEE